MGMRDLIADYLGKDPAGIEGLSLGHGDLTDYFEISPEIRDVPDPFIMFLWNDLCMP